MVSIPIKINDLPLEYLSSKVTQKMSLSPISWQTYQNLLTDLGEHRSHLLSYYQGVLEIKMPSDLHEMINCLLKRIVTALTEELNLSIRGCGSMTLDREDLASGVEPDSCFYIKNAKSIRGFNVDLSKDPPPDLAIEVDITSPSKSRFNAYRQLGIPEIWCYQKNDFVIYQLNSDQVYEICDFSPTFPLVSASLVNQWLKLAETTQDDNTMVREVRKWVSNTSF